MFREAIKSLPSEEFHEFHHKILERLDHLEESGRKGCYLEQFDPKRKNWKTWDMYYID